MIEVALWIGICAIVVASNSAMLALLTKIYMKIGEHGRDIKYIKQIVGLNNCKKE